MSYPDESPRRRFERGSHRAEDWDTEPRVEPRRYESDRLYDSGRSPIPPIPPRARRLELPPIEDTDPRAAIIHDSPGLARREIVVRREQPMLLPPVMPEDPLVDSRRRLHFAAECLIWLTVILVMGLLFVLGSFIFHHVR